MKATSMLFVCAVLATGQTPERTIGTSPTRTAAPPAAQGSSEESLAEAYRRQLQMMSEAEKKNLRDVQNGIQPGSSFVQSGSSGQRQVDVMTPARTQPVRRPATGADSPPDLNRPLTNLDEIRDKYIEQAGKGNCPPAILMRMADLKWRLGQRGIQVASPQRKAVGSDYVAIGEDWFKTADTPAFEAPQAALEDVLPASMVARRSSNRNADADEDTAKMRSDYDALAQACANSWR